MTTLLFLVEDTKPVRDALAQLLISRGDFEVAGVASTEAEANLWLEDNAGSWDLAIVDLILAEGTGMGVINKARRTHPNGHIVVFSDFATPGIIAHCRRLGAEAIFDKSHGLGDLVAHCLTLLQPGD